MTDISLVFPSSGYNSPIAGDQPTKTRRVMIAAGGPLPAFTVLGHITGSDTYTIAVAAATDGSAIPVAILASDVDTTAGEISTDVYFEGEFADRLLTYGVGHTSTTVDAAFRIANAQLYIRVLPVLG